LNASNDRPKMASGGSNPGAGMRLKAAATSEPAASPAGSSQEVEGV